MKIVSYINEIPIEEYSEEELQELRIKMLTKAAEAINMELVFE
nr:hypothetical protein [uncultured Cellulosilyticum sp.]